MKRARATGRHVKKAEPRGFRPPGMKPLRHRRQEIFAQVFSVGFDGPKAAASAGYGEGAGVAWTRLMRCRGMQQRVAALAAGLRLPGGDAASVLRDFIADSFVDLSSLIRRDAKPGEEIYDISKATPRQLRALEIRQEVKTTGGRKTTCIMIRPKDTASYLRIVAAELGIGGREAGEAPPSDFAQALAEIVSRGSKAPLRRD